MFNYKNMTFGELLRAFRLRLSMTQSEMSAMFNVPVGTYKSWEYDKNFPSLSRLEYVYSILDELNKGKEQKPSALLQNAYLKRKVVENGRAK